MGGRVDLDRRSAHLFSALARRRWARLTRMGARGSDFLLSLSRSMLEPDNPCSSRAALRREYRGGDQLLADRGIGLKATGTVGLRRSAQEIH